MENKEVNMTVGDRIRKKRIELELTQEELANRIGVKDKTSVSKVESAGDNITTRTMTRYAKALGVTEAFLMGFEDKTVIETQDNDVWMLTECYSRLNDNQKNRLMAYLTQLMMEK